MTDIKSRLHKLAEGRNIPANIIKGLEDYTDTELSEKEPDYVLAVCEQVLAKWERSTKPHWHTRFFVRKA